MPDMKYRDIWQALSTTYGEGEAKAIARTLIEDGFGLSLADALCGGLERLSPEDAERLSQSVSRLQNGEPVQYVTGKTCFLSRHFDVSPSCLIPRPETEELCLWVMDSFSQKRPSRFLDVGTGSGCIAISLALAFEGCRVDAWDISAEALSVASRNADRLGAKVDCSQKDVLREPFNYHGTKRDDAWDVIVSNPPYICQKERAGMEPNVLDHEPSLALFVPDEKPLLFYDAIIHLASRILMPGGSLFFELNPLYAEELRAAMQNGGFRDVEIRCDQFGRKRFARGTLNAI